MQVTKPKPRNVTATRAERDAIIAAAPEHLRCWLLLCSDLAIRSGTAATLGPSHYDPANGVLTFRTKYQNAQQLPVTSELKRLLEKCHNPAMPFVGQLARGRHYRRADALAAWGEPITYNALSHAFGRLKKQLGITRKLTPHDLRRTTARNVYALTHDLRTVMALLGHSDLGSTMWYLQDNLVTVPISALETVKLPAITEVTQ